MLDGSYPSIHMFSLTERLHPWATPRSSTHDWLKPDHMQRPPSHIWSLRGWSKEKRVWERITGAERAVEGSLCRGLWRREMTEWYSSCDDRCWDLDFKVSPEDLSHSDYHACRFVLLSVSRSVMDVLCGRGTWELVMDCHLVIIHSVYSLALSSRWLQLVFTAEASWLEAAVGYPDS